MKRLFISAVLVCGFTGAAMAQSDPGPIPQGPPSVTPPANAANVTAPADTAPVSDDKTVVCRYERATGTLFQTRICHTNAEWKQRTEDAHNLMEKMEENSAGQPRGG